MSSVDRNSPIPDKNVNTGSAPSAILPPSRSGRRPSFNAPSSAGLGTPAGSTTNLSVTGSAFQSVGAGGLGGGSQSGGTVLRQGGRRASLMSGHSGHSLAGQQSARTAPKVALHSVTVDGDDGGIEMITASNHLHLASELRKKYKGIDQGQRETKASLPSIPKWNVDYGVYHFASQSTLDIPTWEEYYNDVTKLMEIAENGQCRAACKYRLSILEEKYNLYRILNTDIEEGVDKKRRGGGVLANATKVDSGIRLTTSMTAMDLLDTITRNYKDANAMEVDIFNAGDDLKPELMKLRMLFSAAEIEGVEGEAHLTVEGLGLQPSPHTQTPSNAEVFDPAINKAGKFTADLLRGFLTRDTLNNGALFAQALHPAFRRRESSTSNQATEIHIEVLGRSPDEWYDIARWVEDTGLQNYSKNMWVIEFPRVKANRADSAGVYRNFEFHQAHLDNMFKPLFEASLLPNDKKNEKLADMLTRVGAFIIRSDEETREEEFKEKAPPPGELRWSLNPSDLYFAYYIWANICSLNALRSRHTNRHSNTFQLRSVAGERATQLDSLIYGFLLCDNISQGLLLSEQPVLQFLYGLNKIGITMSPLSQNGGRIPYAENPLPVYFRRSLNVSLTTENPLLFHHSHDALTEEYSTAATLFKLSPVDVTELARTSVINSSFPVRRKREWLGITSTNYSESSLHNNQEFTCVPTCRLEFRESLWASEKTVIEQARKNNARRLSIPMPATPPPINVTDGGDGLSSVATTALTVGGGPLGSPSGGPGSPQYTATQRRKEQEAAVQKLFDPKVQGKFTRVCFFDGPLQRDRADTKAAEDLLSALRKRSEFHPDISHLKLDPKFREGAWTFTLLNGVYCLHEKARVPRDSPTVKIYEDFRRQMEYLREIIDDAALRAFTQRRLLLLDHRYKLHVAVNHSSEAGSTEDRASHNRDFYQATKVDTNVRCETGMTARQLLAFIIAKSNNNGDDIVSQQTGKAPQTLRQLLDHLKIATSSLTVDDLNVQVDATQGENAMQWTPEAKDRLLGLLLKTENDMRGRYFAEITKLTFEQFKRDNFTFVEYRLPIYGGKYNEWEMLASWFDTHGMACYNNRWMVQIPRIYSYLKKKGAVNNFADYLKNVFDPLWEVSLRPTERPWAPKLSHFLNHISGFDCVEDEAKVDSPLHMADTTPQNWSYDTDPPYSYYIYYIWANIQTLNEFRKSRGYSTFNFRPSCGEAGGKDHLMAGFLLADGINYGVTLRLDPVLQYLCYLTQLGISVSPLSNNTNLLDYLDNPFPKYFRRGLNVSLSTDGPLRYHHTQEPLIEEYSIASKVWKLSPNDMCEIARNSVRQSGFPDDFKTKVSGENFFLSSSAGNDTDKTHLSDIRVAYRYETYHYEMAALEHISGSEFPKSMLTLSEEERLVKELAEKNKLGGKRKEGIIVAHHDDVDVQKLSKQQTLAANQLAEVQSKIDQLKRQNKQLSETYADVLAKEVAAKHQRQGTSPVEDDGPTVLVGEDGALLRIERDLAKAESLPVVQSDGSETDEEVEDSDSGSGDNEVDANTSQTVSGGGSYEVKSFELPPPTAGGGLQDVVTAMTPTALQSQRASTHVLVNSGSAKMPNASQNEDLWTPTTDSRSGTAPSAQKLVSDTNDEVEKLVSGMSASISNAARGSVTGFSRGGSGVGPAPPQRQSRPSASQNRQLNSLNMQRMLANTNNN